MRTLIVTICCSALALAPREARAQFEEPGGAAVQPEAAEHDAAEPSEATQPPPPELDIPMNVRPATPEERARGQRLRRSGTGLIITGGVVAASGLGLTIAYTVIGSRREAVDEPVLEQIEQANTVAQVGGVLLASGLAVIAVGGILFVRGKKLTAPQPLARIRVTPAVGGLVVSGQF